MAATPSTGELLSTPQLATPFWTANLPESLQPWLEEVLVFMLLTALLAVFLRVHSRRINHLPLWWDDWLAIGNICWYIVIVALMAVDVHLGLGLHWRYVPAANAIPIVLVTISIDIMYIWSVVLSKLSLLALYYRVFRFGYFKRACWGVGGLVLAWAIASTIVLFTLCVPFSKYWDPTVEGHCLNFTTVRLCNSIATIVTDVMILCLPVPQIWGLHGLRTGDKLGLTALFALGFFVVSIAAIRIVVQGYDQTDDSSFSLAPDAGWLAIEMAAAIASASFPTMGPALIEMWQYVRHGVDACRGRRAHGKAARTRQGVELRTRNEDAGHEGMGSPQQHPDDVDGSFHRLYSKGQNGSAVTHIGGNGQPLPSRENKDSGDGLSGLQVTVQDDGASEEVPLHVVLAQTHVN